MVVAPTENLLSARALVAGADLVFEHADTFLGSYALRPYVRHLLESWGCRIVGTGAAAAQVADDKIAAHRRLEAAGVPMPAWRELTARRPAAADLAFPCIVKPAFGHGSHGLTLLRNFGELKALAGRRASTGGGRSASPAAGELLVERFIAGRELALAGYEERGRLRWLPPVEIDVPADGVYSARMKWGERNPRKRLAALPPDDERRLLRLAERAWRALDLRDYARFDLRLDATGDFWFLETNVRPSVEPGAEMVLAAREAGLNSTALIGKFIARASARLASEAGR
ncbi:MAG: ATP-grasp domain-containing protein [Planctomycetes bacterium]|nr:ATP-grasp domain-containing protein [Planctomycetota bacterium]